MTGFVIDRLPGVVLPKNGSRETHFRVLLPFCYTRAKISPWNAETWRSVVETATAAEFGRGARGLRGAVFAVSAFFATSCLTAPPPRATAEPTASRARPAAIPPVSVVLLAIDGVRWQEVFAGVDPELADAHLLKETERLGPEALTPNLHALEEDGGVLFGAPDSPGAIYASGPELVSLPGYAEMLTGRRASGCRDNGCGAATKATLADEVRSSPGARSTDVAVVTSWPDIGRIAAWRPDRIAMSTGRSGGPTRELFRADPVARALVDEAAATPPAPGVGDFRPDRYTARIATRYLEHVGPRFLFVSLGEPDEYAHKGDYRGYLRALRHADLVVGEMARLLDERARAGARTVLFVTADHGRARDFTNHGLAHPESARVFLLAWGSGVSRNRFGAHGDRHLADIAPTLRLLFGLAADGDPSAGQPLAGLLEGEAG
jgi:hypothetical protein